MHLLGPAQHPVVGIQLSSAQHEPDVVRVHVFRGDDPRRSPASIATHRARPRRILRFACKPPPKRD